MGHNTIAYPWEGKRCFHVAVVGTMSSGKSTLIDALLGTDCMLSGNMACTASSDETENEPEH